MERDSVSECIRLRKSVRSFRDVEIENEKILKILEVAYWAPSAGGLHWINVLLISDKEKIKEVLSKNSGYIKSDIINAILENDISKDYLRNASIMIIVSTNISKYRKAYGERLFGGESALRELKIGDMFSINDADLAAHNMTLQAHALGIGVCWIGHINGEKIQKTFKIKKEYLPVCLLLMGYPYKKGEEKIKIIIDEVEKEQRMKKKPRKARPYDIYKEGTFSNTYSGLKYLKNEIKKSSRQRRQMSS